MRFGRILLDVFQNLEYPFLEKKLIHQVYPERSALVFHRTTPRAA